MTLVRVHSVSCSSGRGNRSRSGATRVERPRSSRCPTQRNVTVVCRRKTTRPTPTSSPPLGAVKPFGLGLFIEIIGFLWQPVGRTRRRPKPVGARGAPGSGSAPRSPVLAFVPAGRDVIAPAGSCNASFPCHKLIRTPTPSPIKP